MAHAIEGIQLARGGVTADALRIHTVHPEAHIGQRGAIRELQGAIKGAIRVGHVVAAHDLD
jgi:hypothetical protein